ncbi:MAG: polyprenyl diphosphate synthase [Candidatus Paceibacterota bacterium]
MSDKNLAKISVRCVGFIMDGNRRFAKEREQSTLAGHLAGKEKFLDVVDWLVEEEIPHGVFYAFSTENWQRDKTEVGYLMDLFRQMLRKIKEDSEKRKVNVRIIGRRVDLPDDIQRMIGELEVTEMKYKTTVWLAISYGGRAEIMMAVNKAIEQGKKIKEEEFLKLLWTVGMPDPDIIIRTSGEHRLSNFLPWQSVYSEFFFIDTNWPAFTKTEFVGILEQYGKRKRRIGR